MCPAPPPAPRRLPLSAHSCGDRAAWCAAASSISPPSTTWRKVSECAHAHVLRTHARLHATGGPGDREVLSSSRASEVGSSWQGPNWGEGAKPGEGRVLGALGLGMGASGAPAGRILFLSLPSSTDVLPVAVSRWDKPETPDACCFRCGYKTVGPRLVESGQLVNRQRPERSVVSGIGPWSRQTSVKEPLRSGSLYFS